MIQRIRRRGTLGGNSGGGVEAVDRNVSDEFGEGSFTTTSVTLSAIDADLNVAIAASEGDVLLISFIATVGTNGGEDVAGLFNYTVDGVAQFPDDLTHLLRGVESDLISWTDTHVVTAGEIDGGLVTIIPTWGSTNAAIQLRPIFNVVNLGAVI